MDAGYPSNFCVFKVAADPGMVCQRHCQKVGDPGNMLRHLELDSPRDVGRVQRAMTMSCFQPRSFRAGSRCAGSMISLVSVMKRLGNRG